MKNHFLLGFLLAIFASSITFSQETFLKEKNGQKTLLFAHLPTKQACNAAELQKIAYLGQSESISLKLTDDLTLSGEILENLTTSPNVQKVSVRLSNFGNALLHFSIFTQPDNTNKIIGRIIHPKHGDALVIAQENGKYYVTKHKMEFFMVE